MMGLQATKETALKAYMEAKAEWIDTVTTDNIKGDSEKWKILCNAKKDCRMFGILI